MKRNNCTEPRSKADLTETAKQILFSVADMVLRWDARKEQKGKHGKFENLWFGPFLLSKVLENNTFILQALEGEELSSPVNGRFLKHFYSL